MLCIRNEQEVRAWKEGNRGEEKAGGGEGSWIGLYNGVMKEEAGSYKSSC